MLSSKDSWYRCQYCIHCIIDCRPGAYRPQRHYKLELKHLDNINFHHLQPEHHKLYHKFDLLDVDYFLNDEQPHNDDHKHFLHVHHLFTAACVVYHDLGLLHHDRCDHTNHKRDNLSLHHADCGHNCVLCFQHYFNKHLHDSTDRHDQCAYHLLCDYDDQPACDHDCHCHSHHQR